MFCPGLGVSMGILALFCVFLGILTSAHAGANHRVFMIVGYRDVAERETRSREAVAAAKQYADYRKAEFQLLDVEAVYETIHDRNSLEVAVEAPRHFEMQIKNAVFEARAGDSVELILSTHGNEDGGARGVLAFTPIPIPDLVREVSAIAHARRVYFRVMVDACYGARSLKAMVDSPFVCGWASAPSGAVGYTSSSLAKILSDLTQGQTYAGAFRESDPNQENFVRTSLEEKVTPSPNTAEEALDRLEKVLSSKEIIVTTSITQNTSQLTDLVAVRDGVLIHAPSRILPPESLTEARFIQVCREFLTSVRKKPSLSSAELDQEKFCNDRAVREYERRFQSRRPVLDSIQALNYRKCAGAVF